MPTNLVLSSLPHTWIFDVDGTLVKHNGHKLDGKDTLLNGVKELFAQIPEQDMIIVLTSRTENEKDALIHFLQENSLRFNQIICNVPMGERILINDDKPSGLKMAYALDKKRDEALSVNIKIDEEL